MKGKENAIEVLKEEKIPIVELEFLSIISHGTAGAINGVITLDNNVRYAYCSIYTFTNNSENVKIKEIDTVKRPQIYIVSSGSEEISATNGRAKIKSALHSNSLTAKERQKNVVLEKNQFKRLAQELNEAQ